jgi:membrane protein implicated in regulation of membrane protease activity
LDLGIDLDVWPWIWLVMAVAFALVELTFLGGSFVLLPFAASAFVASLLAFYDASVEVQWAVFVFGGGLAFVAMYRWARHNLLDELPRGVGADRLVGIIGTVTAEISPHDTDRHGRVAVDGEVWGALSDTATTLEVGARVRVVSMRGTRVVVEPVAQPPPQQGGPWGDPSQEPT